MGKHFEEKGSRRKKKQQNRKETEQITYSREYSGNSKFYYDEQILRATELTKTINDNKRKHNANGREAKTRNEKNTRRKKSNALLYFIALICIGAIIYAGVNIFSWFKDSNDIEEITQDILDKVDISEIKDGDDVQVVESDEKKGSPYWEYIKMSLLDVDFSELKKTNDEVVGWIQVNGTNINYPFVQTNNNSYYLTHSILKEQNEAGWVFLDYRNNIKNLDKNTIIYAHSRLDKAMFGSLKNLLESDWYENEDNHIIKMSTETEDTLWQVFSVYHLPTTSDYLRTKFNNGSDFKNFANMLQDRSVYDFNCSVGEDDKIITLSTCYKNDQKMVMHAKLIKYRSKY